MSKEKPLVCCPALVRIGMCLLVIGGNFVGGCASLRLGNSEAGLVLEHLVSGPSQSRLASRTAAPIRESFRFGSETSPRHGDLYIPASPVRGGIVLVPGLSPAGRNDPRLTLLARTLARVDFLVLVPDVPGFRSYRVRATDRDIIVDALLALDNHASLGSHPIGAIASSYGVGPTVIATLDPRVHRRLEFVVGVGGYFDLRRLVSFYTTGPAATEPMTPFETGKWIFAMGIAERLPQWSDRVAVQSLARQFIYGHREIEPTLPTNLSPGGRALVELITNTRRNRVPALLTQLPQSLKSEISALNPAEHDLRPLANRLYLLHGRKDNIIPYTESVAMSEAVPGSKLYLIDGLAHVDLRPEAGDLNILLELIDELLRRRTPIAN